jgi:hypothetical protein
MRTCGCLFGLGLFGLVLLCPARAYSQSGPPAPTVPARQVFYSNIEPLTDTIARVEQDPRPKTADGALQALDWLIYGHLNAGGAYDSNVFASPNATSVSGARLQPSIIAARNTGIQRTLLYSTGDFRYYPSIGRTDIMSSTAGLTHVWEIQRDLIFRAQLDATRTQQSSSVIPTGTVTYVKPINYTSLFASTSIEKGFGNFFTAVGGSTTQNYYDNTQNNLGAPVDEHFQNGNRSTVNARLGYHISPIIYTFIEPSANWGRFQSTNLNSEGYQIVGGLGSGRISLFNGEIYAGVLNEHFNDPLTPALTRPIYGGRVSWYPTRFITVTLSGDESLGTSDFSPTVFQPGSATKVDTGRLEASWSVTRQVTLAGKIQFQKYNYLDSSRVDDLAQYNSTITYWINDRLGVVLDYTYADLTSNLAGASYSRSFISLGANSKF